MNNTIWDAIWQELSGFAGGVLTVAVALVILGFTVSTCDKQHKEVPKNLKVITTTVLVDGCEYLASPGRAINADWEIVSHKGNCTNKIHGNVAVVEK